MLKPERIFYSAVYTGNSNLQNGNNHSISSYYLFEKSNFYI